MSAYCVWEDCDQEAVYCPGHALEYANVASEDEAIKVRHRIRKLERFIEDTWMNTSDHTLRNRAFDLAKELGIPLP